MKFLNIFLFYFFSLFLLHLTSYSQQAEGFYVDSTGRLYVKPGTPVFIYMSTKPDGSDAVRIKSLQPEGNPLHWDGHGHHTFAHLNLYLGRRIRFDLYADGRKPITSPVFDANRAVQQGDVIYISGLGMLELKAKDEDSGISDMYYSINGQDYVLYEQPIVLSNDGEYTLKFYSIDKVGNKEDVGERKIVVDTMPPATSIEIDGTNHDGVISGSSRFVLSPIDATGVKETYFSLNGGNELKYTSPISIKQLPEGEHFISWHSTDIVGNDESKNEYRFFVDKTPPMVFEEIVGNTYMVAGKEFSSGRSQLRVVAVDNKAGVKEIYYSINNQPFKLYEKPIYLSEITGAVTIRSYAVDNVDNKGVSDAQGQQFSMPQVDITGPGISYSFNGSRIFLRDTVWINHETKVLISASDRGSGVSRIEYKLNDALPVAYSEPFTIPNEGHQIVSCTAWDNVDNLNISQFFFGVDANAPEIFHNFSVKPFKTVFENDQLIQVYSQGVRLYLSATDDISGVESIRFSVNGAREREYNEPLSDFKAGQSYTLTVKINDRLSNISTKEIRFRVE